MKKAWSLIQNNKILPIKFRVFNTKKRPNLVAFFLYLSDKQIAYSNFLSLNSYCNSIPFRSTNTFIFLPSLLENK